MTRKKLKDWVIPTLGIFILVGALFSYYLISNILNTNLVSDNSYVTDALVDNTIDVQNEVTEKEEVKIIKPYKGENITISKYYYNNEDEEDKQQKSLIRYQNIYMPNTGILYSSDQQFDIVPVLPGKVSEVKTDDILGNIIEIEHANNIVTIYQSVKDVKVKVGDEVTQDTIIATSGSNKLEGEKENCLHFEVYQEGSLTNPEEFLNSSNN